QPPDLSPLLNADHTLLLARSLDQARVRDQPDDLRLSAGWSSFQPAQVDQYSGGAHSFFDQGSSTMVRRDALPSTRWSTRSRYLRWIRGMIRWTPQQRPGRRWSRGPVAPAHDRTPGPPVPLRPSEQKFTAHSRGR